MEEIKVSEDIEQKMSLESCEMGMISFLECPFCGEVFNKNNKPMVLKCTHSICNNCLKLNLITQSKCLTCEAKIVEQDIKKYATNFLLLEIIEKTQKSAEEKKPDTEKATTKKGRKGKKGAATKEKELEEEVKDEEIKEESAFICTDCNVAITNKDFHLKKFKDHKFSDYKSILDERVNKIKEKQKNILDEYSNFNKSFNDTHVAFIDFIVNNFYSQVEILKSKVKEYDFFEVMQFVGFISKADIDKLNNFKNKFFKDERFLKAIKVSNNFDELFTNFAKENITENEYNSFFENYFDIEFILNNKLNDVEDKLKTLEERLGKLNKEKIIKELIEDIGVQVYDSLNLDSSNSNHCFRYAHFITENMNLVVFNPITEVFEITNLKELLPEKFWSLSEFSSTLDIDKKLYIVGGKYGEKDSGRRDLNDLLFEINIEKKTFKELKKPLVARLSPTTLVNNNKLYLFGGKNLLGENINSSEAYDIVSCEWKSLPSNNFFSEAKGRISAISWNKNNNIYLFENLKTCHSFSIKDAKWKVIKLLYSGSYDLNLTNYSVIEKEDKLYFYGGIDSKSNLSNQIFMFNSENNTFGEKGNLPFPTCFDYNCFSLFSFSNCYVVNYSKEEEGKYKANVFSCTDFKAQKWTLFKEEYISDN